MNLPKMNRSKMLGGVLVLVALCVGAFLLRGGLGGLLGGGERSNVPVTGNDKVLPRPNQNQDQGRLGSMFVASSITNDGCPAEETTRFDARDSIYVGLNRSQIPAGTSLFARLYQDGRAIEDTDEVTADQDTNACVWFEFAPSGGFDSGTYSAELFVNGNRAGRANFEVEGGDSSGFPGIGGSGSRSGDAQLGQGYISSQVDSDGCPADMADSFYSDEPIYVAFERSMIPAGTEIFARLNYEGQPVEDADTIYADQDMESCFWFGFEPERGGFDPGNYSVDVFVNGGRIESLPLQVR